MREDKPLDAPSLIELSAHVVASNDNMYKYSQFITPASSSCNSTDTSASTSPITTCSSSPNSPYSFVAIPTKIYHARHSHRAKTPSKEGPTQKTVELPIDASEMVFRFVCQNLKQSEDENTSVNMASAANHETVSHALRPFMDGVRCPLRNMDLSGLNVSDKTLGQLLNAQKRTLTRLDLSAIQGLNSGQICQFLYTSDVQLNALKLLKLTTTDLFRMPKLRRTNSLENSSYICQNFPQALPVVSEDDIMDEKFRKDIKMEEDIHESRSEIEYHFMNFCPKLEELILQQGLSYNIEDENPDQFLRRILSCTPSLRVLDLSEWQSIFQMNVLTSLKNLTTLILYDVPHLESSISTLVQLENLITLDLSQSDKITGQYNQPVTALHSLVIHLLKLKSLDISGTNLIAPSSDDDRPFRGTGLILSDIVGLSYLRAPLKYLGIFNCNNASIFQNIPAEKVCGDNGENQILLALKVYMERPKMMQAVLNESYQLYRFTSNLTRHVEALHLVIKALSLHKNNANLQIAGSASMFYIIRNVKMNRDTKRKVIYALLTGMENHMEEMVMVRNCCLSLCQFEIPQDILFNYNRVASLLVKVLETHTSDHLSQRIVVFLLNSMACHVEGDQKIEVGNIGAIEIILEQIRRKHAQGTCDDVMEVGWSFLWNITDETPTNCDRFLKAEGLRLFQLCYAQFPNEMELVRNMMGLIGNIAEVETLRSQLMKDDYLRIFVNLLDNISEGIEISYNSAGVLAHLVSDGTWEDVDISRDYVMNEIVRSSKAWDLAARRYINYRSFKPILRLLPMFNAPGAQHWAVWALANLTTTDIEKYCRYVQDEGGEDLLKQIVADSRATPMIRELAQIVLRNLDNWRIKLESIKENNDELEFTNMDMME